MSLIDTKQTLVGAMRMSAFGGEADDLTWLFWTKRCERIAWKGADYAEAEVQRGADCDAASPD
jgi:hypothetical protein